MSATFSVSPTGFGLGAASMMRWTRSRSRSPGGVFDLWVHKWRGRRARGEMIVVRFADDAVVGFEHRDDAERFLADLRERFAEFNLELAEEKTRLIECRRRPRRGRTPTRSVQGWSTLRTAW